MLNHSFTTNQLIALMKKAYLDGFEDGNTASALSVFVNPIAASEVAWDDSAVLSNFNDDLKEGKPIC